jgi:uncharacterized RDD family membrane protein YckC
MPLPSDQYHDRLVIETPEHVQFSYELAGLGSRFVALLVDMLLQGAVLALLIGIVLRLPHLLPDWNPGITVWVLLSFSALFSLAYFIILELLWQGQTVGKRLMGLRVIRTNGTAIGFSESAVRNLLRLLDALPAFNAVGALFIFFSRHCQRVGDFAAGTLVVRERLAPLPEKKSPAGVRTRELGDLAALRARLSPQEISVVERFVERRHELAPEVRYRLAEQIAARLRAHEPSLADLGPEEVVEKVYRATR